MEREKRCLALRLPGQPETAEAERQVRAVLGEDSDWGILEIEFFPGRESTLILAHPAEGMYISRDAVEFLAARAGETGADFEEI